MSENEKIVACVERFDRSLQDRGVSISHDEFQDRLLHELSKRGLISPSGLRRALSTMKQRGLARANPQSNN